MRLTAGGVRELHWHTAGEWAIMLYGNARITAIDADGKSFVADVNGRRSLVFSHGNSAFDSGIESGRRRISAGLRRRQLFGIRDRAAHRLDGAHAARRAGEEFRRQRAGPRENAAGKNCLFSRRTFRARCADDQKVGCRLARRVAARFRVSHHRSSRSRSARRAAKCASWIRASSKCRPRSRRRSSRSIRAGFANCTGIPTPTNGNTSSAARGE